MTLMAMDTKIDIDDTEYACKKDEEKELESNESIDKINVKENIRKELPRELERFLDANQNEEMDTFTYNFHLSDNQIIIDVVEEQSKHGDAYTKRQMKPIKQNSTDSEMSMDDTIKRVLAKVEKIKIQRRTERRKRERLKCLYLVVAVVAILLLAVGVVGIRILLSPLPRPAPPRELPTHQWVMDWDPDWPESVVKERRIPILWSSIYNSDYWLYLTKDKD